MIRYLKEDVNYNSFIIINIKDSTWWNRFTCNERNYLKMLRAVEKNFYFTS